IFFYIQGVAANSCKLPYQLGISGKNWSHFYSKTDASNIWIENFSSDKFIKTFKGKVDLYAYVKALTHHQEYSNVLDKNIKALAYKLFDKNLITQNQYQGLLQSLAQHSER